MVFQHYSWIQYVLLCWHILSKWYFPPVIIIMIILCVQTLVWYA